MRWSGRPGYEAVCVFPRWFIFFFSRRRFHIGDQLYHALYLVNRGFDFTLTALKRLAEPGLFRNYDLREHEVNVLRLHNGKQPKTLYTGVTENIRQRVFEHKTGTFKQALPISC